jgi:hypothetical protein
LEVSDCSTDVLPDGPKHCTYRHVAGTVVDYTGGRLVVQWPDHYQVTDVYLARDWKRALPYRPGRPLEVLLAADSHYEVVARFTDRRSGEKFLGVTPIACRSRVGLAGGFAVRRAPVEGCWADRPLSCSVRSDTDCSDSQGNYTGTVEVSCDGDSGTCSDACGDSENACCEATTTSTETSSDGTRTSVTSVEQKTNPCPD